MTERDPKRAAVRVAQHGQDAEKGAMALAIVGSIVAFLGLLFIVARLPLPSSLMVWVVVLGTGVTFLLLYFGLRARMR